MQGSGFEGCEGQGRSFEGSEGRGRRGCAPLDHPFFTARHACSRSKTCFNIRGSYSNYDCYCYCYCCWYCYDDDDDDDDDDYYYYYYYDYYK